MSNGSNKSGTSTKNVATSVVVQSGDTVDLSANPLRYGKKDKAVDGAVRTAIEAFEQAHVKRETEYGLLVDEKGNTLQEAHGNSGSVGMSAFIYQKAYAMTHNHPRGKHEEGCLGGSFSKGDADAFSKFDNLKVMRAAAAEGTYSIAKTDNFDRAGFHQFAKKMYADAQAAYSASLKALGKAYHNKQMKYSEYIQGYKDAFNAYIIGEHNELTKNAKKYGYTYTLERTTP